MPVPPPPSPRERPKTVPTLGQTLEQNPTPNPIAQSPNPKQSTANAGYSLVGLMESGDKSAALFEINGVTQRINLGEEIGVSGWNLLSISDQQAVVSKRGEIHSIYVGNEL
jgi:Tfp pilus assembly protein PilP